MYPAGVFGGHGREVLHVLEPAGNLQGDTRVDVPPVDPVEPEHVPPPLSEARFHALALLEAETIPLDSRVARVTDLAKGGVGAYGRRPAGGGYREEQEEPGKERPGREAVRYQVRNLPESMWTNPDPG